jgi:acetyl-CoA carboxylase carboxyl transferase subunit beta
MSIFGKPQYTKVILKKKDLPKNLYTRCPASGELVYTKELEKHYMVVPKSGYHFPLSSTRRIELLIDEGTWKAYDANLTSVDPLKFKGVAAYSDKIKEYQERTGMNDAVVAGVGELDGIEVSLAVMDFRFLGGSMGSVVGEVITRAIERAIEKELPMIIVCNSGGARMYEGILSLMQMAKTSAALARLAEKKLPYIAVLTDPTTAGVSASFATLGDVIIAEPGAMVGFAGPRVIKETTNEELPEGFQTAEFLVEKGLIDAIVPRLEMKAWLSRFIHATHKGKQPEAAATVAPAKVDAGG